MTVHAAHRPVTIIHVATGTVHVIDVNVKDTDVCHTILHIITVILSISF